MSQPTEPPWAIPNAQLEAAPAQPAQGQSYAVPPPAYPAYGYPNPMAPVAAQPTDTVVAPRSTNAVVLLIVSALAVVATGIIGIPSAVLAIVALRGGARDPLASQRTTRVGWIVLAVNAVIGLALIVALLWWLRRR